MRAYSWRVCLAALVVSGVAPAVTRAQSSGPALRSDPLSTDKLLAMRDPLPSVPVAPLRREPVPSADRFDLTGWAPEHASTIALATPTKVTPADAPKPAAAATPAKADDKPIDAGPDDEIKTPPPAPSNDPLDKAAPAAAAPGSRASGATDQTAADSLTPIEKAIKAAIDKRAEAVFRGPGAAEQRKEREAIAFVYAAHGFSPVWSENGKADEAVDPVLARLARASDDALTVSAPTSLKTDGSPEDMAESDIALTEAVVAYARQASGSRVDPAVLGPLVGARPELADPGEVVDMLVVAGADAGTKLQAINPSESRYVALREKLMDLRAAHHSAASAPTSDLPIPSGPTLRVGMHDPRVPLIRSRFSLDPIADNETDTVYDVQVAEAVAGFQRDNGLKPTGVLTNRTIAALSGDMPRRDVSQEAIAANMEMWRWMPHDLGANRIEVNIPDYAVTVYHEGDPVLKNKVVVGKTESPTPLFSKTMKYLIINPSWYVPQSIVKKEWNGRIPHGFTVSYIRGQMIVKQPAGGTNALGRIKFLFPNDYAVYLHDTQAKSLFSVARRAYSHGCVRVDQPFDFAQAVLNDSVPEGGTMIWSKKKLLSLIGPNERYIDLPKPLPIHIEYFTVTVDPDSGRLVSREDIYGYTQKVAALLAQVR